jgi:anhydro-N-acetylmuramic acid kinase
VLSTDTGPGNTLMDAYLQENFTGKYFDDQSAIASKGIINEALLSSLKKNAFFETPFPKTTGPELFNLSYIEAAKLATGISTLSLEDMMATLNRFTADTIVQAIKACTEGWDEIKIYSSGGGIHNPLLMKNMQEQLPNSSFLTTEKLGIDPNAKEAVLFAVLANETIAGENNSIGNRGTGQPLVSMGKISFPN